MAKREKACKECRRITTEDTCIYCKTPTSTEWFGFVKIISPDKSEIAKRLEIKSKGKYALRVR